MKYYGTVESFDETKGHGFIMPENTGAKIGFEKSPISWAGETPPPIGKRLSYELSDTDGESKAINLQNA
jgi:cold shock CspA family protein